MDAHGAATSALEGTANVTICAPWNYSPEQLTRLIPEHKQFLNINTNMFRAAIQAQLHPQFMQTINIQPGNQPTIADIYFVPAAFSSSSSQLPPDTATTYIIRQLIFPAALHFVSAVRNSHPIAMFGTVTECCYEGPSLSALKTCSTKKCGCPSTNMGSIQPDVPVPACYEDVFFCRGEVKSTRALKVGDRVHFFYQWRVVHVTPEMGDAELDTEEKKAIKKKDIKKKPTNIKKLANSKTPVISKKPANSKKPVITKKPANNKKPVITTKKDIKNKSTLIKKLANNKKSEITEKYANN
jgi:hypothetical protein